ncbi:MAG TPA: PAS domain S-box protein, partial [Pyrinomonadaceae bacterium]|nr:PAS domain S-box protein [Pyrinomonadaceae bacterium]
SESGSISLTHLIGTPLCAFFEMFQARVGKQGGTFPHMPTSAERRVTYRRTDDIYLKAIEDIRDYAIFVTDADGTVTNWNVGAQHILGYTEDEIIGKDASEFFTLEDRRNLIPEKELTTAATAGRAEDERWHVRRDGSRFWASGVVTAVRDQSGKLIGFSKVMRDMTEQNRVTEERDRFFTLSMDMLSIVQLDGRFQRVNPAFQQVLGYSEEELLTMSIFDLIHPDDFKGSKNGYKKLGAGEPIRFMENRLLCKDATYKWVAWSYFPLPEDGVAFGVGRDTTDVRRMHEVLRLRARELEDANRLKDEFLATMSHELRTPLTSILGWARLLDTNQLSEKDRERAVHVIQRNAESQSKLIEDLLDVSRIITGKLKIDFQPASFAAITESAINSIRPAADAKQLLLEAAIDPAAGPIMGDPARLQQVVTNLLSNAIKFTPAGGRIDVRLDRPDGTVRLEVKDTGIGIAPEHLPHIFERFRQVDSSNIRAHGGLGLGLAIVDYLVRQQGGTVAVESKGVNQGATFRVEFPLSSSEMIAAGRVSSSTISIPPNAMFDESVDGKLKDLRILIVEDNVDTRELIGALLRQHGAEVIAVDSSARALTEVKRVKPHLIISDIGMTGENGYEFIRKVRSLEPEAGGRIPAIALTAYAGSRDRRRALLAGFQMHLSKPVEPDDLLAMVMSLTFKPATTQD